MIRTWSSWSLPSAWDPEEHGKHPSPSEAQTALETEAALRRGAPHLLHASPGHARLQPTQTSSSLQPRAGHRLTHSLSYLPSCPPFSSTRSKTEACSRGSDMPVGEREASNASVTVTLGEKLIQL